MNPESPLPASIDLAAERLVLVGRIADDLAHEIRNPLHSMSINLEVLRRGLARGAVDTALERVAVIEAELLRVQHLVEPLVQLLRQRAEPARSVDLGELLGQLGPLLEARARSAQHHWNVSGDTGDCVVFAPPDELRVCVLAVMDALLLAAAAETAIDLRVAADETRVVLTGAAAATADAAAATRAHDALGLARALLAPQTGQLEAASGRGENAQFTVTMTLPRQRTPA